MFFLTEGLFKNNKNKTDTIVQTTQITNKILIMIPMINSFS
nr:MAG TPA: hypothetical protein [Caudoviricetes sp.]